MRSQVAVPVLCAVLGGAVTAGALRFTGAMQPVSTRTIVQQGPLLAASTVGGTAAGDLYRTGAAGVVALRVRTIAAPPTAFDDGSAAAPGLVTGSGIVIDDSGHLLTAAHLVRAATSIEVECGGRTAVAKVVGLDPATDLAVLDVGNQDLGVAPLSLGDSDQVSVGDPVVALGREPGAAPALASGTIAARQSSLPAAGGGRLDDVLQVDADLVPEDVGGPLLDGSGEVIGVNTRMRTADGGSLDLAVPANTARRVLDRLLQTTEKVVGG